MTAELISELLKQEHLFIPNFQYCIHTYIYMYIYIISTGNSNPILDTYANPIIYPHATDGFSIYWILPSLHQRVAKASQGFAKSAPPTIWN